MTKRINSGIIYQLVVFGNEDTPERQWLLTGGTSSEIAKRANCIVTGYLEGVLSYSNPNVEIKETCFKENEHHDPSPLFKGDSMLGEWLQGSFSSPIAGITKIMSY